MTASNLQPQTAGPSAKPELLAPAGSREALLAGMEAGADAFYLGLGEWSARGRAKNFTLDDLREVVPLVHAEGRRVYVALNTLLKEAEVLRVAETVWELGCLEVDALILQDLGLWRVCREAFPELRLHASTQMAVHNAAGVRQLDAMGFSRAVLARECTLPELAAIADRTALPLEVFVHGALCYSLSGLCFASSCLTGRSANRGWCAQPCRWEVRRAGSDGTYHPFSPADLCLLERAWDLRDAGVAAFKIEGRLKGADYVHAAVRAYRKVLDAPAGDREGALGAAREILKGAVTRPLSEGYAAHPRPRDVLARGGRPEVGRAVGRVHRWREGTLTLALREPLKPGDRIRILGGGQREGTSLVLRKFRRERDKGGERITFPCASRVERGAAVYKVKDAAGEELEQRLLAEERGRRAPSGLPLRLCVGFGEGTLRVSASCGPARGEVERPVPFHPAERHPLDFHTLQKHLGRLGATPYRLEKLRLEGQIPPVVIPPSDLKLVRDAVVAAVDTAREAEGRRRLETARGLRGAGGSPQVQSPDKRLWIRVETAKTLHAVVDKPCHRLVVAMNVECLRARDRLLPALGSREKILWELPPWIPEGDAHLYRERLEVLAAEGYREALATNLGHFSLLEGLPFVLHAGRELHGLNGWAAESLGDLGCRSFTLSPESDRENLVAMAEGGWPLAPLAYTYGNLPFFTTRLDPSVTLPEGEKVETSEGQALWWRAAPRPLGQGWARVYGDQPLSWAHHMAELQDLGVADFLFDFQGRAYGRKELEILLKKFRTRRPLKDSVDVNYERGLR